MIAALFVETNGVYFGLPGVDPWDQVRDARKYEGPHRVIAHPPCQRWGRYWGGGPNVKVKKELGADDGCFASALASVRRCGGVLEHPEASHAWRTFGLLAPPRHGGWVPAGDWLGWTCCVEQGHYGHPARKATWLYLVGKPIDLIWGPSSGLRIDEGWKSTQARREARARGVKPLKRLTEKQRIDTPILFRDELIRLALSV